MSKVRVVIRISMKTEQQRSNLITLPHCDSATGLSNGNMMQNMWKIK